MVKFSAIKLEKDQIRKEILHKLCLQSSFDRARESAEIKKKLFEHSAFKASSVVMFYVSKEYEVSTEGMITEALRAKKKVLVPVTNTREKKIIPSEIKNPDKELGIGPYGIKQPTNEYIRSAPTDKIDIVITPGIAFDKTGNRIGHGAGYYDAFLKTLPETTLTIGLAYDCQLMEKIPTLSWDVPVQEIISA